MSKKMFHILNKRRRKKIYEANMKILIKEIKINNEKEILYYKSILLFNNKKIYDIIEENNILYIYYASNENLDKLLNQDKHKECVYKGHCRPPIIKKEINELFKKEDSMSKIKSKNDYLEPITDRGFFIELNMEDIPLRKVYDIKINKK